MNKTFEELNKDAKAQAIFMAMFNQKSDGLINWDDDCEIITATKNDIISLGYDADDVSQFLKEQYEECEDAEEEAVA